jgi:hypothetical protein
VRWQGHLFLFLRASHQVGRDFGCGFGVRSGGSGGEFEQRLARAQARQAQCSCAVDLTFVRDGFQVDSELGEGLGSRW